MDAEAAETTDSGADILLVEDDDLVASALRLSLAREGHRVHHAANVREALEMFEQRSVDVVLTDLVMPGRSGIDLLREIDRRNPLVPVVIITADDRVQAAAQAVREKAFDYLTKPVSRDLLRTTVQRALVSRRETQQRRREQEELKREHQQLAIRHQRTATLLSVLFNRALEGIIVFDESGRVVDASDSFVAIVGSPLHDLLDRDARDLFDPHPLDGDLQDRIRALATASGADRQWRGDVTVRSRGDRGLPARLSLSLCDMDRDDVRARYVVGLLFYETGHEQSSHHLQQADRLATIGLLAGSAAHEIKNDLGPLLGYLTMIEEGREDPVASGMVGLMRDSVRRVHEHVEQILRPLRPRVRARGAVVLRDRVQSIIELLRRAGRARRVELRVEELEEVVVHADKDEVHQIAINLITNAVDALPDGNGGHRGAVTIRLGRDGDYGRLEVQDDGTGIPEHLRGRVFEPFFTTKGAAGTGLGLPVVHDIVRSLKGRIVVESSAERGTSFTVLLPLFRP
jgi:PAS domain S-box-containing protein